MVLISLHTHLRTRIYMHIYVTLMIFIYSLKLILDKGKTCWLNENKQLTGTWEVESHPCKCRFYSICKVCDIFYSANAFIFSILEMETIQHAVVLQQYE